MLSDALQQLWFSLEEELVEVAVGAFARPKDEVAFQIRRRDEIARQRLSIRNHDLNLADSGDRPD
jgi:hypothetical protein